MAAKLYLAYGSNLNLPDMAQRCPHAKVAGTARLENRRLAFRGGGTGFYLTIEPEEGTYVPAAVWSVDEEDLAALDYYEGFPRLYTREIWPAAYQSREGRACQGEALIYIMRPEYPPGVPTNAYMETCLAGYRSFGFDSGPLLDAYRRVKG